MQRSAVPSTSVPAASLGRMILAPIVRVSRLLNLPTPNLPTSPAAIFSSLAVHLTAKVRGLNTSFDYKENLAKLAKHQWTIGNATPFVFMGLLALFALAIMDSWLFKILIPFAYCVAILLPITSQFFFPATYILSWVLTYFTSRYIPSTWRPTIHVVLLPTLESVLYGANISDLLTRYTHPILDVVAWVPYGIVHFMIPAVVAAVLWIFAPKGAIQFWAKAFGLMMLWGVLIQLLLPCSAPWYEIIHGLTPANYAMPGSPGGLMRIDRIFGTSGYTNTFGAAPLVFGAFPSLHSGNATIEALTLSHFFPKFKVFFWAYALTLYWATMYLTHHYLIDVVGGGCLAMGFFYWLMPRKFRNLDSGIQWDKPGGEEYELVDGEEEMDIDAEIRALEDTAPSSSSEASAAQPYPPPPLQDPQGEIKNPPPPGSSRAAPGKERKAQRSVSWGVNKVLGSDGKEVEVDPAGGSGEAAPPS